MADGNGAEGGSGASPGSGWRLGGVGKSAGAIAVSVIGAILVTALTPLGENLREMLFPTHVAVRGSVTLFGEPASAKVVLDDRSEITANRGSFVLGSVGAGTHRLHLEAPGGGTDYQFSVDRGSTSDVDVGTIQLRPFVQPLYTVDDGPAGSGDVRQYDVTFWLEGSADALSRVKTARYTLPAPLPAKNVAGAPAHSFCWRHTNTLSFTERGFDDITRATIVLQDGSTYVAPALANLPGAPRPPACSSSELATSTPTTGVKPPTPKPVTYPPYKPPPPPPPPVTDNNVTVPSVVGQTYEAAAAQIQAAHLKVTRTDVDDSAAPEDAVVGTEPEADTSVARESTVTVQVSKGSKPVPVPNVTGQDLATATATLAAVGLTVVTTSVDVTDPAQDGHVLEQDPAPETEVKPGSEVMLGVGSFKGP